MALFSCLLLIIVSPCENFSLRDFLGLSVEDQYKNLARQVHACADATGNGKVSVEDFEVYCKDGMPAELTLSKKWEEAFPDPLPELSPELMDHSMGGSKSSGSNQGSLGRLFAPHQAGNRSDLGRQHQSI